MNASRKRRLENHYTKYFGEEPLYSLDNIVDDPDFKVDVLIYAPTEKYDFWKFCTVGVSDYKMPMHNKVLPNRNEYMIFVDKDVSVAEGSSEWHFYVDMLMWTAKCAYDEKGVVTYAHDVRFTEPIGSSDMCGVILSFPEVVEDASFLRCRLSLFAQCTCLQVVPVTSAEMDYIYKVGAREFLKKVYPEEDVRGGLYLAERNRSKNVL